MKKLLLLILFTALFSCNKEQLNNPDISSDKRSNKISVEALKKQAVIVAGEFNKSDTKASNVSVRNSFNTKSLFKSGTKSSSSDYDLSKPQMYVINFENNNGFAILADDNRLIDNVIAYSPNGNIDMSTDNPALLGYIEQTDSYFGGNSDNSFVDYMVIEAPSHYPYNTYTTDRSSPPSNWGSTSSTKYVWACPGQMDIDMLYPPLLKTEWGQRYPYNTLTPTIDGVNTPTGCAATAMVQIMSYHKYPNYITFNNKNTYINWDAAIDNNNIISANIPSLMRDAGSKVWMNYKPNGSSARPIHVPGALRQYGYTSSDLASYNENTIFSELKQKRPVFVAGYDISGKIGHGWVVDGANVKYTAQAKVTDYLVSENGVAVICGQRTEPLSDYELHESIFFHCNWGWNGDHNGYFRYFITEKADLRYHKTIIYNIHK